MARKQALFKEKIVMADLNKKVVLIAFGCGTLSVVVFFCLYRLDPYQLSQACTVSTAVLAAAAVPMLVFSFPLARRDNDSTLAIYFGCTIGIIGILVATYTINDDFRLMLAAGSLGVAGLLPMLFSNYDDRVPERLLLAIFIAELLGVVGGIRLLAA